MLGLGMGWRCGWRWGKGEREDREGCGWRGKGGVVGATQRKTTNKLRGAVPRLTCPSRVRPRVPDVNRTVLRAAHRE